MVDDRSLQPIRVTFFGDSICVGQGVSIYRGWVTRLAEELDRYWKKQGVDLLVTNASVNGRTTRQALEDMPYHVQSHGVDVIVVQFGLNDCNYWLSDQGNPRVALEAFKANIGEIVARARTFGARKILLNNNHPTSRGDEVIPFTSITYEESNRTYNAAIRSLSEDLGKDIIFQDVEGYFRKLIEDGVPLDSLLLDDGLHLSEQGHDRYLEFIGPKAQSAIRALVETSSPKSGQGCARVDHDNAN
ncbi:SGNH/GDSL hydrolase family protein [Pyruvatibacter mobilis]|uniref:SGNH/GDSL hydrolase family protein n=1 Tax=Pyruvatibacter mobilis TaxID=1712261 RepID=UPI003BAD5180